MTGQLTFLLNGEVRRHAGVTSTTTLHQIIREQGLTGTKEGCAEGDCGACTVALGTIEAGALRLRAVNSCIMLAGQLQGRSVTTVEALKGPDGQLHPVQQAMVAAHGSQCGFCTPGFVMTLYVAHATGFRAESHNDVTDLIAGNLCRCTGYGPIIDAARSMEKLPVPAWQTARLDREAGALRAIAAEDRELTVGTPRLFSPTTLAELTGILSYHPDATLVAGATDVGVLVTKQQRALDVAVHLDRIAELRAVSRSGDVLTIGAAVTYADLPDVLFDHYPLLAGLVRRIGSTQVRNSGTVGGNIANGSPIGDMAPALIAIGATLVLQSKAGLRRLPLEDYFIAYGRQDRRPGEFIAAIEIPLHGRPRDFHCFKVSKRRDQDISAVCGAFDIKVEQGMVTAARIAHGGMAGIPKRARQVEAALIGKPWARETMEAATAGFAADFQPIDDLRASAAYRMLVAKNMLRRVWSGPASLAGLTA